MASEGLGVGPRAAGEEQRVELGVGVRYARNGDVRGEQQPLADADTELLLGAAAAAVGPVGGTGGNASSLGPMDPMCSGPGRGRDLGLWL